MTTINGVDPLVINSIKSKTEKQVIIAARELKITDDKNDEDREKDQGKYPKEDLENMVQKGNQLLDQGGLALYLQLAETDGVMKIQMVEKKSQNIITEISPANVLQLLRKLEKYRGLAIDHQV